MPPMLLRYLFEDRCPPRYNLLSLPSVLVEPCRDKNATHLISGIIHSLGQIDLLLFWAYKLGLVNIYACGMGLSLSYNGIICIIFLIPASPGILFQPNSLSYFICLFFLFSSHYSYMAWIWLRLVGSSRSRD